MEVIKQPAVLNATQHMLVGVMEAFYPHPADLDVAKKVRPFYEKLNGKKVWLNLMNSIN